MNEDWRRTHEWGALTRAEIAAARDHGALPVLPVGSVEQHADHLPVDTDSVSAHRVALAAAAACADPHVLVLPPPGFGFSPHHRAFAGTVTLSLETFVGLVTDVAESLHRTGFRRLLVVNGHGGNHGPLTAACTALVSRGLGVGFVNYFSPGEKQWLEALPGAQRGVGHACAYETALQLALRTPAESERIAARIRGLPPRLTPSYLSGQAPDPLKPAGASWAAIFPAGDVGYVGDPAAATPEAGAALLEATVAALARFYADFAAAS
ncbi:MAG TPA: creatininase family protein, partial [Acetobacteraceae bacterium]|nr:creatininase family protein [Acetobacteraceae bacterium]